MHPDNRVVYTDLFGKKYPLCMTVHAQDLFKKKFGSYSGWAEGLQNQEDETAAVNATVDLLDIMLQGGRARVKALAWIAGEEPELPPELDLEFLRQALSLSELGDIQAKLFETFTAGNKQTVEVAEDRSKNAETTQV